MSPRLRYCAMTAILIAIGLGYALTQERPWRVALRLPVRAEASARPTAPPVLPPTARDILNQADRLSLTKTQRQRLAALDHQWREGSQGLQAEVEAATQEMAQFLQASRDGRGANLAEIQRRSSVYQRSSAALREERRRHAEAAAEVLTKSQRETLPYQSETTSPGGKL